MVQPLSSKFSAMSVDELVAKATETSAKVNQKIYTDKVVEVQVSEDIASKTQAPGAWDSVAQPQLDDYVKNVKLEFGPDLQSAKYSSSHFKSLLNSSFNPQTSLGKFAPSFNPPFKSVGSAVGLSTFPNISIMDQVPNYGSFKTPMGSFDCQRNIFQATAAAIGNVAMGAVSNHLKAFQAVCMSAEFLLKSVSDIKSAMMNLSVQDLLALLVSQDNVLKQIISVTKRINDVLASMDENDYAIVHLTLIRREQIRLQQAISKLTSLKTELLFGRSFDYELWESARQDIEATDKQFCGFPELGLSIKPIILVGLVLYLESLLKILARQQAMRDALVSNLANFGNNFAEATQFDNLYVPIIDAIKCRLERILEDMESTLARQKIIEFLIKEKLWCLELMAISAFMKFAGKARLPDLINKFSGTDALNSAADAVLNFLINQINNIEKSNVRSVLSLGQEYVSLINAKLQYNIEVDPIIGVGEGLISEAEAAITDGSLFGGLLNGFSNSVVADAATAVAAVAGLVEFAEQFNLTSFVDSLKMGDILGAFSIDGFTATLEGQASVVSGQLAILASRSPVSDKSIDTFERTTINYQESARNYGLLVDLTNNYAENNLVDNVEIQLTDSVADQRDLIAAAGEISSVPPFDTGISSVVYPGTSGLSDMTA